MAKKIDLVNFYTQQNIEWYTPKDLVQAIVTFFGEIDLDPCANPEKSVPAKRHEMENGLGITWTGKVFVNPPYGAGSTKVWIDKALSDPVDELILLVPARTHTKWFWPCWQHTILFFKDRLYFWNPARAKPYCTVMPSVLVYRGPRPEAFKAAFEHLGHVVLGEPAKPQIYQLPLVEVA